MENNQNINGIWWRSWKLLTISPSEPMAWGKAHRQCPSPWQLVLVISFHSADEPCFPSQPRSCQAPWCLSDQGLFCKRREHTLHLRSGHSSTVTVASAKFSLSPACCSKKMKRMTSTRRSTSRTAATYLRGGWHSGLCSFGRPDESKAGNCIMQIF